MTQSLSVREARKIVLYSQCLDNRRHFGSGTDGTLEAIEHLGYVQLDTLSVVERRTTTHFGTDSGNFSLYTSISYNERVRFLNTGLMHWPCFP